METEANEENEVKGVIWVRRSLTLPSRQDRGAAVGESHQIRPDQTGWDITMEGFWSLTGMPLTEARPHPVPPLEPPSRKAPPHPDPLLHKCVEEREMERRARVLGFNARSFSGTSRGWTDGALGESD